MRTLQEMAAAIDRALPLCEAVSLTPADRDARQALTLALAAVADTSFVDPCQQARPELRGLCSFVNILAGTLRNCMARADEPDHFLQFVIGSKARDLMALMPELKKAFDRAGG
jgi:hypothetical protein